MTNAGPGKGKPGREPPAVTPPVPALQAPWRSEYLETFDAAEKKAADDGGSFLGQYWAHPERDLENYVIARTPHGIILLNKFPYAGGHLLVALGEARGRLLEYTPEQRAQLWALTELAADLMERTLHPQGINFGINEGRAAGAGVPQHLHVHLVPRWHGDVNFMATVGNVRVIPSSLDRMAERYRRVWSEVRTSGER